MELKLVDDKKDEWVPLLKPNRVAKLEKALKDDPEDLNARNLLLQHYMLEALKSDDFIPHQLRHLVWLIENHPDSDILQATSCRLKFTEDSTIFRIVADLWMQQVTKYPDNPAVLGNAAYNLMTGVNSRSDWAQARKWLLKAEKLEPYNPEWKSLLGDYHYHLSGGKKDEKAKEASLQRAMRYYREEYDLTNDDEDKTLLLCNMAECAFEVRDFTGAEHYSRLLLVAAYLYDKDHWNYGNAVHWGHIYLGKTALKHGDKEGALRHLEEAGKTPGSPQLNTFGPDMTLAASLLEMGETEVVLEYFRACGSFWKMEMGRLTYWTEAINKGEVIDFSAFE